MKEINGNLFEWFYKGTPIVIPINLNLNKYGHCVMGAGVAKDAKELLPILPNLVGKSIKALKARNGFTDVFVYALETNKVDINGKKSTGIIFAFPTKWNYWDEKADITLIELSAKILAMKFDQINKIQKFEKCALPKVGGGCGGLDWEKDVKPVISKVLDERFITVNYIPEVED